MSALPFLDLHGNDFERGMEHGRVLKQAISENLETYFKRFNASGLSADNARQEGKKWAEVIYMKAQPYALECNNQEELLDLVESVGGYLNDKTWVRGICKAALEKVVDLRGLLDIAEIVMGEDYLDDKDWATELLKEYESKATTVDEIYRIVEIVISEDLLNNQPWGGQIVENLRPLCISVDDYLKVISALGTQKELGKGLAKEAILLLENDEEKEEISESIEAYLCDDAFAEEVKNSSITELKNKYGKPSTEELKKLYAAGIGDGSVDPVEISFDSFVENYGVKEEKEMTPEKKSAIDKVRNHCWALWALDDFKNDKDVVFEAVKQDFSCLLIASEELRCSGEFVSKIVSFIHGSTKEMENFAECIPEYLANLDADNVEEFEINVKEFEIIIEHLNKKSLELVIAELNKQVEYDENSIDKELNKDEPDDDEIAFFERSRVNLTNLLSIASPGEVASIKIFRCPSCESNEIRFYQGVPAQDTYYAYRVDLKTGGYGREVVILPRMDRVERVEDKQFYMCHGCMESWETWEECESQCIGGE